MSKSQFFRAGVGAMIINKERNVLVCRRADIEEDQWQMPQGGIHVAEEPIHALYREVKEETGIEPALLRVLTEAKEWIAYELPPGYRSDKHGRGQVHKWFLCRFEGDDAAIRPDKGKTDFEVRPQKIIPFE